jgi:hypothetical protein
MVEHSTFNLTIIEVYNLEIYIAIFIDDTSREHTFDPHRILALASAIFVFGTKGSISPG